MGRVVVNRPLVVEEGRVVLRVAPRAGVRTTARIAKGSCN